jgi:hypothetical protein
MNHHHYEWRANICAFQIDGNVGNAGESSGVLQMTLRFAMTNGSIHKGMLNSFLRANKHYVQTVTCYSNIYPTRCNVTQFIFFRKLLYMFRVVPPPIIRSANNCIYSIWYLSHRYCYLPLKTLIYIQQNATLHSLFHLETVLHVSGSTTTHHHERTPPTAHSNRFQLFHDSGR